MNPFLISIFAMILIIGFVSGKFKIPNVTEYLHDNKRKEEITSYIILVLVTVLVTGYLHFILQNSGGVIMNLTTSGVFFGLLTISGISSILFAILFIIDLAIGIFAVKYLTEYWATYIKGTPTKIPFIPCLLGGLFFGRLAIPIAILTWIISFTLKK